MILLVDFSKRPDKERLYNTLKGLREVPYQVELKVLKDTRSNNQNRYYWGVMIAILSDHTGFTPEEMHYELKKRFLKYFKALPTGEQAELVKSTRKLDTKEFEDYMEKIRIFSALELDVIIPLPNEIIEI